MVLKLPHRAHLNIQNVASFIILLLVTATLASQMELCERCNEIDFGIIGLQTPGDQEFNPDFDIHGINLQEVAATAEECPFCEKVCKCVYECLEEQYGSVDYISVSSSRVHCRTSKIKRIDGRNSDDLPSLLRFEIGYSLHAPDMSLISPPLLEFQRCTTENNYVASMFNASNGTECRNDPEPYIGRIRPLGADCRLFKRWKEECLKAHYGTCGVWFNGGRPPKIRLIDVEQKCLIEMSDSDDVQWVALSYVWGKAKMFAPEKDSLASSLNSGFLSRERLPRTIYDAIVLTAALGETYLWVNSICIYSYRTTMKHLGILKVAPLFCDGVD